MKEITVDANLPNKVLNKSGVSDKYFSYFSTNIYVVTTCGAQRKRLGTTVLSLWKQFEQNVASDQGLSCLTLI